MNNKPTIETVRKYLTDRIGILEGRRNTSLSDLKAAAYDGSIRQAAAHARDAADWNIRIHELERLLTEVFDLD